MNPKLYKRFMLAGKDGNRSALHLGSDAVSFTKASVHDQAALLLSIADIVKSEISSNGISSLWREDDDGPMFPLLLSESSGGSDPKFLAPRSESLRGLLLQGASTMVQLDRLRSVSFDGVHESSPSAADRTMSPIASEIPLNTVTPTHSPVLTSSRHLPRRNQSLRLSAKARHEIATRKKEEMVQKQAREGGVVESKSSSLQGAVPKGVPIKRIVRRKFSWKNYPELEQFLIRNREEYLRHSALNYTLEQKQYNNGLTDGLLDLATEHGYVFEPKEFSFVIVRDRIRCYYKSYVQSSKKRGILMGYAARKAGLLSVDEVAKGRKSDTPTRKMHSS